MPKQRVLFFGAPGQVGQAFQYVWEHAHVKPEWELALMGRQDCDITDAHALRTAIQTAKPDLLINAASLSIVDAAEQNEVLANKVNFHAVANMAAQCSALDIPMIQISTDYVFDGEKGAPYLPDDQMNPVNIYGASKMMGEEAVRHELAWHVVLRVSSVFSAFRRNILTNTLKALRENQPLRMVTDIVGCPTPATDIVKALIVIGGQLLNGKTDGYGTFHLCGTPACSRFDFTQRALEIYNRHSHTSSTLTPTVSAEFETPAKRPANTAMDCAKIKEGYGIGQRPWEDGLEEAMKIYFEGGRSRL